MAMQAFGTPYGPLVAPDVPEGINPQVPFMTAFQIAANNNAKQRALENQLQHYALQAKKSEIDRTLDWAKFGLAQDRLEKDKNHAQQMYELGVMNSNIRDKMWQTRDEGMQNRLLQAQQQVQAKSATEQALQNLEASGVVPGSKDYVSEALKAIGPQVGNLPNAVYDRTIDGIASRHNAAGVQKWRYYNMQRQLHEQNVGQQLGYDANLKPLEAAIYNPGVVLKPKMEGGLFGYGQHQAKDEKGNPVWETELKDYASGKSHPATVTQTMLNKLKEEADALEQLHDDLPGFIQTSTNKTNVQVDGHDADVSPETIRLRKTSLRALQDPGASAAAKTAAQAWLDAHP